MKPLLGLVLFCATAAAALAGPNGGGTIAVHDPGVLWTVDQPQYCGAGIAPTSCSTVDARLDGTGAANIAVWKVYALFADPSSPRLSAVSFGVHYPDNIVVLEAYGPCPGAGGTEFPGMGWPRTDTGTTVAFGSTQTDRTVECYWFAGYAESPAVFQLRDHPDPEIGGCFADDDVPSTVDPIIGYGSLGFDVPGSVACPTAFGACCDLKRGTCTLLSLQACAALGHDFTFTGFPSCAPNPCPQRGPCCIPDYDHARCTVMSPDSCAEFGGAFLGHCGQRCPGNPPCEPDTPIGACCVDTTCTVTLQSECGPGGIWSVMVPCIPSPCGQIGACCAGPPCYVTYRWDCDGEFFPSMSCQPDPCFGLPEGACCARDATCTVTLEGVCHPPSVWLGPGTVCVANPCLDVPGACCLPNGACTITTIGSCPPPDQWMGVGTDCDPNPCYQPIGACCNLDTHQCYQMTWRDCERQTFRHGYLGDGTTCYPNPCYGLGACCNLETYECHLMTQDECEHQSYQHDWLGEGTSCEPNPCSGAPPTPAEITTWGRIKATYGRR